MHLVIPFASALSDAAAHAAGTLALPNLQRLLGRWSVSPDANEPADADEYTLSTPHERVLAGVRGWRLVDGLLPFAAEQARADGLDVAVGSGWGLLTPTHWHVGRDQINLVDPALLELGESEARVFHETLRPLFEDLGWGLHWAGPTRWYVSHPSLAEMPTASLDRVIGRNVDYWLNDHPGILLLRRLQSEAQMLLYVHPLNDERTERGLRAVNSFWISGTGAAPTPDAALPPDVIVDDRLRTPAVTEDWSAWADAWQALDAGPIRALAEAAAGGATTARLTLCGERLSRRWEPAPRPWWRRVFGSPAVDVAAQLNAL